MRVAVLDVTSLVRVRETFRARWRVMVALVFLLLIWSMLVGFRASATPTRGHLLAGTVAVLPLAVLLCAALPRKGVRAQLLFTCVAAVDAVAVPIAAATTISPSVPADDALGMVGSGFVACWIFFGRYAAVSMRSVVPLPRWRAHAVRLALCRRMWSGEWRGTDPTIDAPAGEPHHQGWRPYLRMGWGWTALALGLASGTLLMATSVNTPLQLALYRLRFHEALDILRNGVVGEYQQLPDLHPANSVLIALMIFGFLGFRSFAAEWELWSRRKVPVRRAAMRMTESSVLLLRSFHEEQRGVPQRVVTLRNLPLLAHGRAYTFVDLVVERLSVVGPVKLFGWSANLPPPRSGDRYFTNEWEQDIRRVIPLARMIVVLYGTTESLAWELNEVRDGGFLATTVFLLPPDLLPARARRRWTALAGFLCPHPERRRVLMKTVRPRRVLAAVCPRRDLLVVITGPQTQPAYESALDLATLFALENPAVAGEMVTEFLPAAVRRLPWPWRWRGFGRA